MPLELMLPDAVMLVTGAVFIFNEPDIVTSYASAPVNASVI